MMTSIKVENVSVHIDNMPILKNISTNFDESKFIGIVGPNGSGKTTLLRVLNGHITPAQGNVYVGSESITQLSAHQISKKIAVVPQNTMVSFDFTVREIVEMGRYPHSPRFGGFDSHTDIVTWAIKQTDLSTLSERTINSLSGGEKARVFIARTLAQETPILLLDEPIASLDFRHTARILSLIKDQVDTFKKTAIVVLHDLELAANFCDQLLLLSEGEILSMGAPKSVLTRRNIQEAFDTNVSIETHPLTGLLTINVID
ncbi:MAG TPA: ABC transporter ATP-binding protein [Halobacteriales archaeon]|uniref:ABC transporter ATP-binding protein n=1 Tax=Candidatus Hikarchaeum yamanae TaxID=2675326 RepID=UPI0017F76427|nr:ABC transporter ATP-binding protein [Halobacteriales archaeon]|tara:strand:- start:5545 stop:6321 length:777 start_codon:yes stop_codon:yes gene_type:complete